MNALHYCPLTSNTDPSFTDKNIPQYLFCIRLGVAKHKGTFKNKYVGLFSSYRFITVLGLFKIITLNGLKTMCLIHKVMFFFALL